MNVDISQMNNKCSYLNRLDPIAIQSSLDISSQLLDADKLSKFIKKERLEWINSQIIWLQSTNLLRIEDFIYNIDFGILPIPKRATNLMNRIFYKLSSKMIKAVKINDAVKAFNEWSVIKPIEYMMIKLEGNAKN